MHDLPDNKQNSQAQVIVARYYNHLKAHLVLNELQASGILAFINNEVLSDLIPFGDGGYIIRVYKDSQEKALEIIAEIEENLNQEDEDFRDANHDDIAYEKLKSERVQKQMKFRYWIYLAIAVLIILYLMRGAIL